MSDVDGGPSWPRGRLIPAEPARAVERWFVARPAPVDRPAAGVPGLIV